MTPHARRDPPRAQHFIRLVSALALIALIASCDLLTTLGLESDDPGDGSSEALGDFELTSFEVLDGGGRFTLEATADTEELVDSIFGSVSYDIYLSTSASFTPETADVRFYMDGGLRFYDEDGTGEYTSSREVNFQEYVYEYLSFVDVFIPDGTYYAAARVDARDEFDETNEANNFLIHPEPFTYENPEDTREENDTRATATPVSDVTFENGWRVRDLYTNEGDDDWFIFDVLDAPGTLMVVFDTDFDLGASGEVALFDAAGTELGSETGSYAVYEHPISSTGTYYARVRPAQPVSAPYEFSVVLSEPDIPDDSAEDNDDPGTASLIGDLELNTIAGYTDYVSLDDDFYEFRIPSSGNNLTITVLFSHAAGNIDAVLVDSSGLDVLRTAVSTTDNETIVYDSIPQGTYYLWVEGAFAGTSYDIEFRWEQP